jgi:hypothetical protein
MKEFILAIILTVVSFSFGKKAGERSEVNRSAKECQYVIDRVQKEMLIKFENLTASCN